MLPFYELQLVFLACLCAIWLFFDHRLGKANSSKNAEATKSNGGSRSRLMRQYLTVYAIVMGADWLQGPYVYSLYREQYSFPERLVAVLFVTGFMSAGVTAPVIGAWADHYGRKRLCQVFCVTYTVACVCIMMPILPVLLFGRLLGGVSTSILYSAFESWLITSSNNNALTQSDLSSILGRATLLNGFVATGAGVFSNQLVGYTGSFSSPFAASAVLLVLAFCVIQGLWSENYGSTDTTAIAGGSNIFQIKRLKQAVQIVRNDSFLLVIGLTQTCFEGSMYLFVFLWVPSLQEASLSSGALPLGYIFSCFMVSMMLGSLLYTTVVSIAQRKSSASDLASPEDPLSLTAKLSSLVCAVSALSFAVAIAFQKDEHMRFWSFCVFEACVGMYYPVQGMLRGALISDEHRATLSSLFRVPLNIFVVVSLLTGVSSARDQVLTASAIMLGVSSIMTAFVIVNGLDKRRAVEILSRAA